MRFQTSQTVFKSLPEIQKGVGIITPQNKQDSRVPMMQVHALFAGKSKPQDVLAAAEAGSTSGTRLKQQLFYAHLYLGLYYEAEGQAKLAREHITKAARDYPEDHYMGQVARVHLQLLDRKDQGKPASSAK